MATEATQAYTSIGLVVALSGAAVIAICGAIVAWLKWRHTPDNK